MEQKNMKYLLTETHSVAEQNKMMATLREQLNVQYQTDNIVNVPQAEGISKLCIFSSIYYYDKVVEKPVVAVVSEQPKPKGKYDF